MWSGMTDAGVRIDSYWVGLYWSTSTMFSGSSYLEPQNPFESVLSQAVVIFGAFFISFLVSDLSAIQINFQMMRQEQVQKLRNLRQFLNQHKVMSILSLAIQKQVSSRMNARKNLSIQEVSALKLVSTSLRSELRVFIHKPCIVHHALVRVIEIVHEELLMEMCGTLLNPCIVEPGEAIFQPSIKIETARIPLWGTLEYVPARMSSPFRPSNTVRSFDEITSTRSDDFDVFITVVSPKWISEMALWVMWSTRGMLEASSAAELCTLDVVSLTNIVEPYSEVCALLHQWCLALCFTLEVEQPNSINDVDVGVSRGAVILNLPLDSRIHMARPALSALRQQRSRWAGLLGVARGVADLDDQVHDGRCCVWRDDDGTVLRIVRMVTLRLERFDGFICIQLADWKSSSDETTMRKDTAIALPSAKARPEEQPSHCVEKFLQKDFVKFEAGATLGECELITEQKPSPRYGVDTVYFQSMFHATLKDDFEPDVTLMKSRGLVKTNTRTPRIGRSPTKKHAPTEVEDASKMSLNSWEVFAIQRGEYSWRIYAWMSPSDFDLISENEDQAKSIVTEFLSGFDHPGPAASSTRTSVRTSVRSDVADVTQQASVLADTAGTLPSILAEVNSTCV